MDLQLDDTIAALASAPGPGARGIIRISGAETRAALGPLFTPKDQQHWNAARGAFRHEGHFFLSGCDAQLPCAVYLWPHLRSYTGQIMAELHTIGSPPLLEAALREFYNQRVRPARPGEFTLRAFLAGRIDLVQAEAVLGVIDAPDHTELLVALQQLAGGISGKIGEIRCDLLDLLADLEAGLDFVEEDIEFIDNSALIERLARAQAGLDQLRSQSDERIQTTGRWNIVLAGLPNAGKSTLFNALIGQNSALVSEVRGTTRDYLQAELQWNGLTVQLIDTAGWESESDNLTQQAQTLRHQQMEQADLILWCTACDFDPESSAADARRLSQIRRQHPELLIVQTKCDLPASPSPHQEGIRVSAHSGEGLKKLIEAITWQLSGRQRGGRQLVGMTASRCRESLTAGIMSLEQARAAAEAGAGDELVAIEIRDSLDHLGRILGSVYTDDILDRIFSKFCIGK